MQVCQKKFHVILFFAILAMFKTCLKNGSWHCHGQTTMKIYHPLIRNVASLFKECEVMQIFWFSKQCLNFSTRMSSDIFMDKPLRNNYLSIYYKDASLSQECPHLPSAFDVMDWSARNRHQWQNLRLISLSWMGLHFQESDRKSFNIVRTCAEYNILF